MVINMTFEHLTSTASFTAMLLVAVFGFSA
jgi:hypothetical protein